MDSRRLKVRATLLAVLLLGTFSTSTVLRADVPRYRPKPDKAFAYDTTITIETPDQSTTYKGTTRYEILSSDDEQFQVRYSGGLTETVKAKPQDGDFFDPFRGLGPRGIRRIPDPFSRPRFAGKTQTTNTITFSSRGAVNAMEGDSQLPYLLGNVSLMPFEVLPEDDEQKEWVVDTGISISKGTNSRRRLAPFQRNEPKSVQAGREITRYEISQAADDAFVVNKSYELSTPRADGKSAFEVNGTGTWIFNRVESMPESVEFEQKLVIKEENTATTIPITVKFRLVPDEELAVRDAESKRLADEKKAAEEEAKRIAETPFTAEETAATLEALASNNVATVQNQLKALQAKSIPDPDPVVASAIELLLTHSNLLVQSEAKKALVNWSPSYKLKYTADKAYSGSSPVKSTDLFVGESTPLYSGQLLQVQQSGTLWYPAEVLEVFDDHRVRLQVRGGAKREVTVTRRQIQLGPPELTQPADPNAGPTKPVRRWWTDTTGRFRIEATFVKVDGESVKLLRADGKSVTIPVAKLSQKDRTHISKLTEPEPEDPFKVEESP